jgi:hypothetical protein
MALAAATTLGLLLPPASQHERITRSCERSSSSSRFSYVCRRAPSRALAVDRTSSSSSSSSSASTSTTITATGKLVENEKNEIKKKKEEEEGRENRNGALSTTTTTTTTTLERNEDNRLPGLMNVESFAKDTITSDVVSVHDYMDQVRVLFVRSFVRSCVCVCVCPFVAVCREAPIPLCDDDEKIVFSFGKLDSQGLMCPSLGFVEFRCRFSWGMMEGLLAGFVLFSVLRLLMMPHSSSFSQVMCIIPSAQYLVWVFFFLLLVPIPKGNRSNGD